MLQLFRDFQKDITLALSDCSKTLALKEPFLFRLRPCLPFTTWLHSIARCWEMCMFVASKPVMCFCHFRQPPFFMKKDSANSAAWWTRKLFGGEVFEPLSSASDWNGLGIWVGPHGQNCWAGLKPKNVIFTSSTAEKDGKMKKPLIMSIWKMNYWKVTRNIEKWWSIMINDAEDWMMSGDFYSLRKIMTMCCTKSSKTRTLFALKQ